MSRSSENALPPELREALQAKPPAERERIQRVWELLGALEDSFDSAAASVPDTEAALKALEGTIETAPERIAGPFAGDRPARARQTFRRWAPRSVVLGLILIAAIVILWRQPVVIDAAPGEQIAVRLPDGTQIELNSGSRIEFPRRFQRWPGFAAPERRVHLEGEAFFEVSETGRPFIVESFNARVRVLGTAFNVRARPDDFRMETQVTLSSGRVQVISHALPDKSVILQEAGHTARVGSNAGGAPVAPTVVSADLMQALTWRTKGFAAVDKPLADILAEIERRYALTLRVDGTVDLARSLNVFIADQPRAIDVIQAVCLSQGCRYRRENDGFTIFIEEAAP